MRLGSILSFFYLPRKLLPAFQESAKKYIFRPILSFTRPGYIKWIEEGNKRIRKGMGRENYMGAIRRAKLVFKGVHK